MTQENKFALIIGFALMLVVGILVSDHLSELARGGPGSLASAVDPLSSRPPAPIEYMPLTSPVQTSASDAPDSIGNAITMSLAPSTPAHVVQRGETLHAIAQRYYGDARWAPALGAYNTLPDPNRLRAGVRLLVPDRGVLESPAPPVEEVVRVETPTDTAPQPSMARYTVQSGDTLSELAQKLMGTARATHELWQLNQSVLESPDALRPGMMLEYPRSSRAQPR